MSSRYRPAIEPGRVISTQVSTIPTSKTKYYRHIINILFIKYFTGLVIDTEQRNKTTADPMHERNRRTD